MFNFDYVTKEDLKKHNPSRSKISDHPYQILIIGCTVSGKTNALLDLINYEPDIDKIYLYANDLLLIKYKIKVL